MKKVFALLLSLAIMITYMPMTAFAADEEQPDAQETIEQENPEVAGEFLDNPDNEGNEDIQAEHFIKFHIPGVGSDEDEQDYGVYKFGRNYKIDKENDRYCFEGDEDVKVYVKASDNHWLDRIIIGDGNNGEWQYDLHPSRNHNGLSDLPNYHKVEEKNEVWTVFTINFDTFEDDGKEVYIESLFSSYDPELHPGETGFKSNKYQVIYDNLHGKDYNVEVNRNNAGWNQVDSESFYQYVKGDKLKFRINTPALTAEEAKDKNNYPAIEISENGQDEEGNDYFIYSDEKNEALDVNGNTFTYEPKTDNGVKVKVWWSIYGHEFDTSWSEDDMSNYYVVRTDVCDGYGLVGYTTDPKDGNDLHCVDAKSKLRYKKTAKTTPTIKIEPDDGNELDYIKLDGEYYYTNPKEEGQKNILSLGQNIIKKEQMNNGSSRYLYSLKDKKSDTTLYAYFRERTDWEKAAEKINNDKFAYYVSGDNKDEIKNLLATEMYKKRLRNVFTNVDKLKECLSIGDKEKGGAAGKGRYPYSLEYENRSVTGYVDVLEHDTDIVVSTSQDNVAVVSLSDFKEHKYYSVKMPYNMKTDHSLDYIKVYGNGIKIGYEYEIENERIGYQVTNDDNIDYNLTIFNTNVDGNDYDNFSCGEGKSQIRYVVHNARMKPDSEQGKEKYEDVITLLDVNSDDIFDNSGYVHGSGAVQSYKANVEESEYVTFQANPLSDGAEVIVYSGTTKLTVNPGKDGKFTIGKEYLDDIINIFINHGDEKYALINYKNHGDNRTNVSVNNKYDEDGNPENLNIVANPNGDGTKSTGFISMIRYNDIDESGKIHLTLGVGFPQVFEKIYVNGEDRSESIPQNREDKIKNFYMQQNNVVLDVEKASDNVYNITSFTRAGKKEADNDELFIGNFGWTNSTKTEDRDDCINGGTIKLVKAVYKEAGKADKVYYDKEKEIDHRNPDSAIKWNDLWEDMTEAERAKIKDPEHYHGGEAVFPEGTEVTVSLTPDYGKQLVSFGVNNKHFDKGDINEKNEYTFVVQSGNAHLCAKFDNVSNTLKTVDNIADITGTSITFAKGAEPVDAGTLNMSIDEKAEPAKDATNVVAAVDINIDNVFYAGKNKVNKDWTENVSELDNSTKASINMTIDAIDAGDTVSVIRQHKEEDGTTTETTLPSSDVKVNSNGSLTIKSDQFSTYTICKKKQAKGYIKSATISATTFTYSGGYKKPTVKSVKNSHGRVLKSKYYTVSCPKAKKVGTYYVIISGKKGTRYYGSSIKVKYTIIPKGTSIKSLKKAKKAFTVKWSMQSGKMSTKRITGYEVQYSTSSKFKSGNKTKKVKGYKKTSLKVTGLKAKKTYYVHVRTYLGSYKSTWSKTKIVKTK